MVTMATEEIKRAERQWKERELTEKLLETSDILDEEETFMSVRHADTVNDMCCWEKAVPNCKFAPAKRRRQVPVGQSKDDIVLNYSNPTDRSLKNYEMDFVDSPAWRICVEPTTYRYVPNNGRYRATKLARKLASERDMHRMVGSRPSIEHRQLQKGIQRQLRREFDMYLKMELQREATKVRETKKDEGEKALNASQSNTLHGSQGDLDKVGQRTYSPVQLPPIKVSLVRKGESRQYINHRLSALNEEMKRDSQAKKISVPGSPEEGSSRATRSRSEPPGLGSLVDPGYPNHSYGERASKRRSRHAIHEQKRKDAQVKDLANQLVSALTELQKTRDQEVKQRFSRESTTVDVLQKRNPIKSESQMAEAKKDARINLGNGDHVIDNNLGNHGNSHVLAPLTHNVRYTTSTGDVISIPKFGRYTGILPTHADLSKLTPRGVKDLNSSQRNKSPKRSPSGKSQGNQPVTPISHYSKADNKQEKETLNSVITTTKYVSINSGGKNGGKLAHLRNGELGPLKGDKPKVITDSFHSLPVGKHRHRERRGSSPITQHRHGVLPEIAGRGLPKTVAPNKMA